MNNDNAYNDSHFGHYENQDFYFSDNMPSYEGPNLYGGPKNLQKPKRASFNRDFEPRFGSFKP